MNFSTPERVLQTIRAGDEAEWVRGENRSKINNAANCVPPLDDALAKKMQVKININWGEMAVLLAHARRQYLTNFYSNQHFFKISLPLAPAEHQTEWGNLITEFLNKPLRESLRYFEIHRSKWSGVVSHGIGPVTWHDDDDPIPHYLAIEDLRVPTDTTLDFENLSWYGERRLWKPQELLDTALCPGSEWDKKSVAQLLKNTKNINWDYAPTQYDWETQPEKFYELQKQDGAWYAGDAQPTIPLWHFYFEDKTDAKNAGWFMAVVPAEGMPEKGNDKFLFRSNTPVAPDWQQLIHVQYGDLNAKAPFLYKSVRSLGFELLEPCFYTNLTRCRMLQHVHDQFNPWFRSTDPADKARAQMQEFGYASIIRPGVSLIPNDQRHQIDPDLVEMAMAQLKQLMQEASSTYTQQIDTGTRKEQTAFETNVKLQQVNAMLGGLMLTAFKYEGFLGREICRRFCRFPSKSKIVQEFQRLCRQAEIPRKWLNVAFWDIEPVTQLGMGNPAIAQAQAKQLMEIRPMMDPTAQQEVLHDVVLVTTGDSRKAARWVPLGKDRGLNDAQRDAQLAFGTLMQGVPIKPREGYSLIDQIESMLPLYAGKINMLEQRDNMATPDEVQGLKMVHLYLANLVQQLAQNPQEKARVKKYNDDLGQLMNILKGLAQRGQEAAQQKNGMQAEMMAKLQDSQMKLQGMQVMNALKFRAKQQSDAQKLRMSQMKFAGEERRKNAAAFGDIQREDAAAHAEIGRNNAKASAEMVRTAAMDRE